MEEKAGLSVATNYIIGAKFIAFHLGSVGNLQRLQDDFETRLHKKYDFDTGYTIGTVIRDWQLDIMEPKERKALTVALNREIAKRKWKVMRIGEKADVFTDY